MSCSRCYATATLALVLACSGGEVRRASLDFVPATESDSSEPTPVEFDPIGSSRPPEIALGLNVQSATPRRLSLAQLTRSLDVIARLPPGTIDLERQLQHTLGVPDFLTVTQEALEPSPLFMKVLMDLGAFYCDGVTEADAALEQEARTFLRFESVESNIADLTARFTGLSPAPDLNARLRTVYDRASSGALGERGGWQAVCVALITSPEFLVY
ncbi:MAG: hypothetical protein AAFQ82_14740 [Myxococcota bacterium]